MAAFGGVIGAPETVRELMRHDETILVFPGGGREIAKFKGEEYALRWQGRSGFARVSVANGYPIVPVGLVGGDDVYRSWTTRDSAYAKFSAALSRRLNGRPDMAMPLLRGSAPHSSRGRSGCICGSAPRSTRRHRWGSRTSSGWTSSRSGPDGSWKPYCPSCSGCGKRIPTAGSTRWHGTAPRRPEPDTRSDTHGFRRFAARGGSIERVTGRADATAQRLRTLVLLRRVRDRIDRDYTQPLNVEALARDAHMSAGHLSREFRSAYGESPYSYLMTRRIERAMALLRRGDLSVTEVCFAVGCSSLGTFSSRFTGWWVYHPAPIAGSQPMRWPAYHHAWPNRCRNRSGIEKHPSPGRT